MSEACTHDCSTCGSSCSHVEEKDLIAPLNKHSSIKHVYAIMSGKGGVGKSSVTSNLAVAMAKKGYKVGIMDADITGPSIPKLFGLKERVQGDEMGMYPVRTKTGISVMSTNLLLPDETTPVIWRGAVIAGTVTQFWTDTIWKDIDYMFVDMPPGTGDVPLTVFQSLPVDGIIIVTSPQQLVSTIVNKAVRMAEMMNIPIVGIVENYSFYQCKNCGDKVKIFGESHIAEIAEAHHLPVLASLPIDPDVAKQADAGLIELFEGDYMETLADILEK